MAIAPPSDIVFDVARAVDAEELAAARQALMARIGGSGEPFGVEAGRDPARAGMRWQTAGPEAPDRAAFVRFEAMVMQSFIESMLPSEAGSVYGEGLAGDMWKSMMAEQMADALAGRGGIGIADRLLADHYRDGERKVAMVGAMAPEAREAAGEAGLRGTALVHEIQRTIMQTLDDWRPEDGAQRGTGGRR